MKTQLQSNQHNLLRLKGVFLFLILLLPVLSFSQRGLTLSPKGVFDKVFDSYGNTYNLSDLMINKDGSGSTARSTQTTCSSTSIFNVYYETGSGMEDNSGAAVARRAVICQVLQDISAFINTPLSSNGNKVNIWVRNIANIPNVSSGMPGIAGSYFDVPSSTVIGGITDNEIWKTIHTGVDSYANVIAPLVTSGTDTNASGVFYHGYMAFNFSNFTWNTNTGIANPAGSYDLYSVALHEMMHALGIISLIDENGTSRFNSSSYQYFGRFDQFLQSPGATPLPIITALVNTPMYNNVFNTNLLTSVLWPGCTAPSHINNGSIDATDCDYAIKFVGTPSTTGTIPVYTPICYERGSSLSHFEDACVPPNGNNTYFAMCNAGGTGVTRRYLKPTERYALCDIGYSVNSSYGVSGAKINGTDTFFNYGGSSCDGIIVAGVNDGFNANGTYAFIGNSPVSISGSVILSNDINVTGFESLQDITTNTMLSTGGTTATNVTLTSSVPGLHLLRYVPIRNVSGTITRGNITYVYAYINDLSFACPAVPTGCDLVVNGDFEQHLPFPAIMYENYIDIDCGWANACGTTDPINNSPSTPALNQLLCNFWGSQAESIPGNGSYAGFMCFLNANSGTTIREVLKTRLRTPLSAGVTYRLSFNLSQGDVYSNFGIKVQAFLSPDDWTYAQTSDLPLSAVGILLPNANSTPSTTSASSNVNGWDTVTYTFTAVGGEQYLYLGGLRNITFSPITPAVSVPGCYTVSSLGYPYFYSYNYVDNISIVPTNGAAFDLPESICFIQALSDLTTYVSAAPATGYFTGTGVVQTGGIYSFNPATAGIGTSSTITYHYTDSSGCARTLSDTIAISNDEPGTPVFTFVTTICAGATPPTLPTKSFHNAFSGTWSPTTVSNTVSGDYVFTPGIGQCGVPVTVHITVNPYPVISSSAPSTQTVCLNSAPIPLQVNLAGTGYTYKWYSNTSNNNTTGTAITSATASSYIPVTTTAGTLYYYVIVKTGNCSTTSAVFTVIVSSGTANAGTLSGAQTLCKSGHAAPTTIYTASVTGGAWSSSNTGVATVTPIAPNYTTATIRWISPGTATISYTVTGTSGCTATVTRTITMLSPAVPTFTQFPINPMTGSSDPYIICSGATPISLPTSSNDAPPITGTWDPTTIDNITSGLNYFNPTAGQCATGTYVSVVVVNNNDFAANNDVITVLYPVSTTVTNSVLGNDTYLGDTLNYVPSNLSYSIVTVGTLPTFTNGGATLNADGTFTIQPDTTPGIYVFNYRIATSCGNSNTASVTLTINNFVESIGKVAFVFCFNAGTTAYNSQYLQYDTSLYNNSSIEGVPASPSNSTIVPPAGGLPAGVVINANGTVTITSSVPVAAVSFYYKIRSIATGYSSSNILCTIVINPPFGLISDSPYYNTSGTLFGGGTTFNVLSNDQRNVCNGVNVNGTTPLLLSTVSLTGSATSPAYFTIQSNGNVLVNPSAGGGTSIPIGTYSLTYTACDTASGVCSTQTVTIHVTNVRMAGSVPGSIMNNVTISPNPSSGVFEINGLTERATVIVYDILGQKVMSFTCASDTKAKVDLSGYPNGTYLLRLEAGGHIVNRMLLKK